MKWRKIFLRKVLRFRRKHTYLALGGIALLGVLFGALLYQTYYQLAPKLTFSPQGQPTVTTPTPNPPAHQPNNVVQESRPTTPPPPPVAVSQTATTPVPQVSTEVHNYPSGSADQPVKQGDKVTTTCKGVPHASCQLRAIHVGTGEVVNFTARITDQTGVATWVWSPSADGLTQGGEWSMSAVMGNTSSAASVYIAGQVNAL